MDTAKTQGTWKPRGRHNALGRFSSRSVSKPATSSRVIEYDNRCNTLCQGWLRSSIRAQTCHYMSVPYCHVRMMKTVTTTLHDTELREWRDKSREITRTSDIFEQRRMHATFSIAATLACVHLHQCALNYSKLSNGPIRTANWRSGTAVEWEMADCSSLTYVCCRRGRNRPLHL